MTWLWTIGIIIAVLVVMEVVVIYGERFLTEWLPNWKTELVAWLVFLFGIFVQLDPTLFAPLFGDSQYTGLFIAILGIVFRNLRQITFTPGSRVPKSVAAADAAETLAKTTEPELEEAAEKLEAEPKDTRAAENIITTAIEQKA
jgi:hypothetical protein